MHTLLFCSNSTMLKWSNNVSPLCEINPLEQGTSMATVREVLEKIKHTRLVIEAALHHPELPPPNSKHAFRHDLHTVPEVEELYPCIYKLYSENPLSVPFRETVNALGFDYSILDYYTVIKEPKSLRIVLDAIAEGKYSNDRQVLSDLQAIWDNCEKYNAVSAPDLVAQSKRCAQTLQELIATRRDEAVAPPEEQERIMNQIEAMQDDADLMEKICGLVEKEQPNALTDGALDLDRVLVGTIRKIQLLIQKHKVERGRMTPGARGRVTPR